MDQPKWTFFASQASPEFEPWWKRHTGGLIDYYNLNLQGIGVHLTYPLKKSYFVTIKRSPNLTKSPPNLLIRR